MLDCFTASKTNPFSPLPVHSIPRTGARMPKGHNTNVVAGESES